MHPHNTIRLEDVTDGEALDAVIIGGGPSGSSAAALLARDGWNTLLVDKQDFPRDKVCGGCLSGRAVAALQRLGLEESLEDSIPLQDFILATANRSVRLSCRGGRAISRRRFDARLASCATDAGARFLPETKVSAGELQDQDGTPKLAEKEYRQVKLTSGQSVRHVRSRVVLLCAGLGKAAQKSWGLTDRIHPRSRIGITSFTDDQADYPTGSIFMCVSRLGYLGLTALEDGRLNLSACVDQKALASRSANELAEEMIRTAGFKPPGFAANQHWMATPALTRQLDCPAGHRLFVLGDAAGYAEPFTGQGMAWGLEAAEEIRSIAAHAIRGWDESLIKTWKNISLKRQKKQQRVCNAVKWFARSPLVVANGIRLLRLFPALASPVIRAIHRA